MEAGERVARLLEQLEGLLVELRTAYQELEAQALTDELTGLYNRRHLMKRLPEELERGKRYNHQVALLLLDLDDFKSYNDRLGHPVGDDILRGLAGILQVQARNVDMVARYGGEEFVLLLPETDLEGARIAARRLCAAVAEHPFLDGTEQLTISVGAAVHPDDAEDTQGLLDLADQALRGAKDQGKNRVVMADEVVAPEDAVSHADADPAAQWDGAAQSIPATPPARSVGSTRPPFQYEQTSHKRDPGPTKVSEPVAVGFQDFSREPATLWLRDEVLPVTRVVQEQPIPGGIHYVVETSYGYFELLRKGSRWRLQAPMRSALNRKYPNQNQPNQDLLTAAVGEDRIKKITHA